MIYILAATLAIITLIIMWLALIDGRYHVNRSITINKKPEDVWPFVYDFDNWKKWSPWLVLEKDVKVDAAMTEKGPGSRYIWEGEIIGSGAIEHKEVKPYSLIDQEIRFRKPFKSQSQVYWKFKEKGTQTRVTWGMQGKMPFFLRFMSKELEPMVGNNYDRGLKLLKEMVEKGTIQFNLKIEGIIDFKAIRYFGHRRKCELDKVGEYMEKDFKIVEDKVKENGFKPSFAISVYHDVDFKQNTCEYECGFPFDKKLDWMTPFQIDKLNGSKAFKITFTGPYRHLPNAWSAAYMHIRHKKVKVAKQTPPFEVYLNNPSETKEENLITEVFIPLK